MNDMGKREIPQLGDREIGISIEPDPSKDNIISYYLAQIGSLGEDIINLSRKNEDLKHLIETLSCKPFHRVRVSSLGESIQYLTVVVDGETLPYEYTYETSFRGDQSVSEIRGGFIPELAQFPTFVQLATLYMRYPTTYHVRAKFYHSEDFVGRERIFESWDIEFLFPY